MENNRSEDGWEGLNEYLKEQIFKAKDLRMKMQHSLAIVEGLNLETTLVSHYS